MIQKLVNVLVHQDFMVMIVQSKLKNVQMIAVVMETVIFTLDYVVVILDTLEMTVVLKSRYNALMIVLIMAFVIQKLGNVNATMDGQVMTALFKKFQISLHCLPK